MQYKALLIDDERRALNILSILIKKHLPEIEQVETALGPTAALEKIRAFTPDLLFLDIEMPGMTGFEFLEEIRKSEKQPQVIFTTAYDHYAIRAIKFSALDYLLKPIDIDELKMAFNRFREAREVSEAGNLDGLVTNLIANLRLSQIQKPRLAVPTQGGAVFFDIDEIIRCEADNNYTIFHLEDGRQFITAKPLKDYDNLLSDYHFLRIHQSHLVHPSFIAEYTEKGRLLMKDGSRIPVSRRKHHWLQIKLRELYHG